MRTATSSHESAKESIASVLSVPPNHHTFSAEVLVGAARGDILRGCIGAKACESIEHAKSVKQREAVVAMVLGRRLCDNEFILVNEESGQMLC